MNRKFILTHKKLQDVPEGYTVIDNTKNKEIDHRLFSEWAGIDLICKEFDKMNAENPDFVTIAQYRRMPDPDCIGRIYVAQPMIFPCSIAQQYASMHFIEDLEYLGKAIKECYPNLVQISEQVLNGNIFIPYNIVNCPYGQFRDWTTFVLTILKKVAEYMGNPTFEQMKEIISKREIPKVEGRNNDIDYQARVYSFESERLSTIYWLACARQTPVYPAKITLSEEGQKI